MWIFGDFTKTQRIDNWWFKLSKTDKYAFLCNASLALLTCFHGPKVESSFSEMNDLLDPQSSRMKVQTLDALHTIRYRLKSDASYKYFARVIWLMIQLILICVRTLCLLQHTTSQNKNVYGRFHKSEN